jgi:RNA polymerase sigma-70 factor (ECF subfamily)
MDSPQPERADFLNLLAAARNGDRAAVGRLLEMYRDSMRAEAARNLSEAIQAKLDESDIVQHTFLEAQQDFARFQGDTPEKLAAWLKMALLNNVRDEGRRYRAAGRHVARELSLDAASDIARQLTADSSTPSGKAAQREEDRRLDAALASLPEEHREAILLRHRDDLSFAEIGSQLGLSENAARKLWVRAVAKLREALRGDDAQP